MLSFEMTHGVIVFKELILEIQSYGYEDSKSKSFIRNCTWEKCRVRVQNNLSATLIFIDSTK